MASQKNVSTIVLIGVLVLLVFFALYKRKRLINNFMITDGYIYEFGNSRNSGNTIFFKFRFVVDQVTYYGNTGVPCARTNEIYFQSWKNGKKVEVVYEKEKPDNCSILLSIRNYNQYSLKIPEEYKGQIHFIDSLRN
ncbi:MAG: hypothetical protein ABUT20_15410 [Bacteroidota bacterium]